MRITTVLLSVLGTISIAARAQGVLAPASTEGISLPGAVPAGTDIHGFIPPGEPATHALALPLWLTPAPPDAGTPPSDPRNFEGQWTRTRGYNALFPLESGTTWSKPPFRPQAERIFWHRVEMENAGTPVPDAGVQCKPMGVTRFLSGEFGMVMLQSPQQLTWLLAEDHLVRRIRIGATHPRTLQPSYMGDSVAHWERDTLVIDSVGFNRQTWLDFVGTPHSASLHVTERLRRLADPRRLEDLVTIADPIMYTRPWSFRTEYSWSPVAAVLPEITCEENNVEVLDYTGKDLQP